MQQTQILDNIRHQLHIEQLNALQQAAMGAKGNSLVILAPTGSGKTLAFAIPLLRALGKPGAGVQAVVLAPARELVLQIHGVLRAAAAGSYRVLALYGGHSMESEVKSLSVTPDIVVATPGRLLDHINRGQIDIDGSRALVIDEFDKCLELGFAGEMRKIVRRFKRLQLTVLTSATPLAERPDYLDLAKAQTLDFRADTASNPGKVYTRRVMSASRDKLDSLVDLLHCIGTDDRSIIFVNHRESADRIYDRLRKEHVPAGVYHGGLEQQDRELALRRLANGSTPVLVSTDLGSRGLDIDGIGHVIHYHMPPTTEANTHRNGRTGRMGADGDVYYITSEADDIPDYVDYDSEYTPQPDPDHRFSAPWTTLYMNQGKKDKLSRGDIAGFLMQQAGLAKDQVGKIDLGDHYAMAAIPSDGAKAVLARIQPLKIKGRKVKFSLL